MNKKELYLVVTHFIQQTNIPSTSVSDIFENEADAWSYVGQQVDELSKKDKNPTIVISQLRKIVMVLIGKDHESDSSYPTPSTFIFSINKTHNRK